MDNLSTANILTGAAIALSIPLIIKVFKNYFSSKNEFKYPNEIDFNAINDDFNKRYEELLVEWCNKYPNGCTLSLKSSNSLFERLFKQQQPNDTKIVILNSIDAIKNFSKDDLIANRPHMFLLDVISRNYKGSFFRMYDSDCHEVRKSSLYGLQRLVLSNPDAEDLVNDELERFFTFIDNQILKDNSGLLENAQIFIQQLIVNIIFRVSLDIRFDYDLDKNSAVKTQLNYMSTLLSALNIAELSKVTPTNANSNKFSKTVELLGGIVNSIYKFITDAVVGYKQNDESEIKTFADLLLKKQKEEIKNKLKLNSNDLYSNDDIIVQVFTVFLATCGTTGFTHSWGLNYLSKSPNVVSKLITEIESTCGDINFISWKQRSNMCYAEATINEILRLSSTQALIPRETRNQISLNGLLIPKNTPVLLNTFGIHHNNKNFLNANEFKPERWLSDDVKSLNLNKENFIPFGVAPRTCIGDTLSKALLFSILLNIINRFSIECIPVENNHNNNNEGRLGVMRCPFDFNLKLSRRY